MQRLQLDDARVVDLELEIASPFDERALADLQFLRDAGKAEALDEEFDTPFTFMVCSREAGPAFILVAPRVPWLACTVQSAERAVKFRPRI